MKFGFDGIVSPGNVPARWHPFFRFVSHLGMRMLTVGTGATAMGVIDLLTQRLLNMEEFIPITVVYGILDGVAVMTQFRYESPWD